MKKKLEINKIIDNKYFYPVLVTVLLVSSFFIRLAALNQTEFGNGWDVYFYLEQLQSLVHYGKFHSPDVSLIYPYFLLFYFLTGSFLLAVKAGSALLSSFLVLSSFLLVKKLSGRSLIALMIASFLVFSPTLTFFTAQFPKNLMGLGFLIFFLYFFLNQKKIAALIFFILAFITHRSTAGLSIVFLVLYFLSRPGIFRRYWMIFASVSGIGIAVSFTLPGTIHIDDFLRFKEFFGGFQFPFFSFFEALGKDQFSFLWTVEIILICFSFFFSLFLILKQRRFFLFPLIFLLLLLIFPFFRFNLEGPAYRFFLIFLLVSPLLFFILLERVQNFFLVFISLIFIIFSFFSYSSYQPKLFDPPYEFYHKVIEKSRVFLKEKDFELLVAKKALAEMTGFEMERDAMAWKPDEGYRSERVYRFVSGVSYQEIFYYLGSVPENEIYQIAPELLILREDLWEKCIQKARILGEEGWEEKFFNKDNPYKRRPGYLLKNKEGKKK